MGLFDKVGGSKKEKKEKQPKQKPDKKAKKGGMFGGKKKNKTLFELMQLEESVAAASLDVVQELADIGESAVRETDEGLLIVAITNDILESTGLEATSEEFGSFAEALRSETVESIALAEDLKDGVIGIIPSEETLISLDEFDFIHDVAFKWALVPFDLEDEDKLVLLDSDVDIGRLVAMAGDSTIEAVVKNGEISFSDDDFGEDDYSEPDANTVSDNDGIIDEDGDDDWDDIEDDAPAPTTNDTDGFDLDDDDDLDFDDEPENDYGAPVVTESVENTGFDLDDDDELDLDTDDDLDDESYDSSAEEALSAEESKEIINRVATHSFNNTELGLEIDMTRFDDLFSSQSVAQFDTSFQDNSELQRVISNLRQDANTELRRLREDNTQILRTKYASSLSDIHNRLVEALDHKNPNTTYGAKTIEVENTYDVALSDIDRETANKVARIRDDYNEDREEFGDNAKREALSVYDSRHRDKRDQAIANVSDTLQADHRLERDTDMSEIFRDRREVAKRLYDKALTALMQKIQEEFQGMSRKELKMYDTFRKDMDVYLRKHYADEVLRSKAEAESLRQSHEAERVRSEYEQMLTTKARLLDESEEKSRIKLRELEETHAEDIASVKEDYERRIDREQRDNKDLRETIREANQSAVKIGEQKDKEVEHRLNTYENTIKSKDMELKYANDRLEKSQRPMYFIMGAIGAVMLALGIIFGFLFGAGQSQPEPQPAPAQYGYADEIDYNLPVGFIDFSGVFVDDEVAANTTEASEEDAAGAVVNGVVSQLDGNVIYIMDDAA